MDGCFSIDIAGCKQVAEEIRSAAGQMNRMRDEVSDSMRGLGFTPSYWTVKRKLSRRLAELAEEQKKLLLMESKLLEAVRIYQKTELELKCQGISSLSQDIGSFEAESVVFDSNRDKEGLYGGDQNGPNSVWNVDEKKALYDIVRQHYPDMTDKEIRKYLQKLNSEGCGYVAVVNSIFEEYQGREAEFEKIFGFPMYQEGKLNYNRLLVDFYASTDNHNPGEHGIGDVVDVYEDYNRSADGWKLFYDADKDTSGRGMGMDDLAYRTKLYLNEKGVDVTVINDVPVDVSNVKELTQDGTVVLAYYYGNLRDVNGNVMQYINGGHGMVITGVTEDGRYIVSSWGNKYYIDPNESVDNNGKHTSMSYTYIQY